MNILTTLKHPNILKVIEFFINEEVIDVYGEYTEKTFGIMEYCDEVYDYVF